MIGQPSAPAAMLGAALARPSGAPMAPHPMQMPGNVHAKPAAPMQMGRPQTGPVAIAPQPQPSQTQASNPSPPPPPQPAPTVFDTQTFLAATQLLHDKKRRGFRVDIETESTIIADQEAQQKARSEMLQAVGAFLQSALPMIQAMPSMLPLAGKMIMFLLRSFNTGVELEGDFEDAIAKLQQNPAAALQNPQAGEQQAKQQEMQGKMALQQQKMQQDAADHQMDIQGRQIEMQADQVKAAAEMRRAVIDEQMARMDHQRSMQQGAMEHQAAMAQAAQPLAPQKLPFGAGVLTRSAK